MQNELIRSNTLSNIHIDKLKKQVHIIYDKTMHYNTMDPNSFPKYTEPPDSSLNLLTFSTGSRCKFL